jgi:hypothetical protein
MFIHLNERKKWVKLEKKHLLSLIMKFCSGQKQVKAGYMSTCDSQLEKF